MDNIKIKSDPLISGLSVEEFDCLKALEEKAMWLSSWIIHNANHLRKNRDGIKVGGHQASSASLVTLLTALYFRELNPSDRVAVKPHASPVFHSIQYLMGNQTVEKLQAFRAFGGAQSYTSRTKDIEQVDFSTGSVGLGVAVTLFASLIQDYLESKSHFPSNYSSGRMVALMGDAELDEGNVWEAMLEGWKHDVRNLWWIIDYNRQSLDSTVSDKLFGRFDDIFRTTSWNVIVLKYGKKLSKIIEKPGGESLLRWIDECPNSLYSALTYKGGEGFRSRIEKDIGKDQGVKSLLQDYDNNELYDLSTDLAGHDMESVLESFTKADPDRPNVFIAYTVKGRGMPFAGHKDNHAGLMTIDQMKEFKKKLNIPDGMEWDKYAGLKVNRNKLEKFIKTAPFNNNEARNKYSDKITIPDNFPLPKSESISTQDAFGKILNEIGRNKSQFSDSIITASPDVSVSTNLGAWINQRGLYDRTSVPDQFKEENVLSPLKWSMDFNGQHIELGIAENNLFLFLAAAGLSGPIFGSRLLPIGTLYDPFIMRGLDALNYACYQDSRFMLVATPSGLTLAPEGGAHQSISTPLIGMAQDNLLSFEPAFVDELSVIMKWAFWYMQEEHGSSVYLRLSTKPINQPVRKLEDFEEQISEGAYWYYKPKYNTPIIIVYTGPIVTEVIKAFEIIKEDIPDAGILSITSSDLLYKDWKKKQSHSHIHKLLSQVSNETKIITVIDGYSASLAWVGSVKGNRVFTLGVDQFGQCGDTIDLYREYKIDSEAIIDAIANALLV